nr:MAG: hypothetical protein [uncultured archaeon]
MNNKTKKLVRIYIAKLTEHIENNYKEKIRNKWSYFEDGFAEYLLVDIIYYTLLERICLELSFQELKIKERCKNYKNCICKMDYIVDKIWDFLYEG